MYSAPTNGISSIPHMVELVQQLVGNMNLTLRGVKDVHFISLGCFDVQT